MPAHCSLAELPLVNLSPKAVKMVLTTLLLALAQKVWVLG